MSHLTLSGAWDENPTLSSLLVKSKCSRLFGDFLFGELNIKKKTEEVLISISISISMWVKTFFFLIFDVQRLCYL